MHTHREMVLEGKHKPKRHCRARSFPRRPTDCSDSESGWAAYAEITLLVKSERPVRGARQTDSRTYSDGADLAYGSSQPQRARAAEIHPVVPRADTKGPRRSSRASSNFVTRIPTFPAYHVLKPFDWLEAANKHTCACPLFFA